MKDRTTDSDFDMCLEWLLIHEGGFVNHPDDPGGMTNMGITKSTYDGFYGTNVDEWEMRRLEPSHVKRIYKERYWDVCKCDELGAIHKGINWMVFDYAVNSGPKKAIKSLQKAVGSFEDGIIGPKTLEAVRACNRVDIIEDMANEREQYYRSLSTFRKFGRGWLRRNHETADQAYFMGQQ